MKALLAALPMLLALLPAPALAQAYQCSVPREIEPLRPVTPDGPVRRTAIGGYTLSASWSPDYCHGARDKGSMQCSGRNGRFGFILHGLWPEAKSGPPPQWCATKPLPSPQVLRRHLCMTPSAGLLTHEWAKHGSCMARKPETYFKVGAILWDSLRWPDADRLARRKDLTAGDLRTDFLIANQGWKREQVGVLVSRTGWLKEIRLCYSRKFLPVRCDRRTYGPADTAPLKIWRGL